jgi:hypothetical protein
MSKHTTISIEDLEKTILFLETPRPILKRVIKLCEVREYPTGVFIITENECSQFMFILISGTVDLIKGNKSKKIATLGTGTIIGEGTLISGAPRSATIVTASHVKVAIINKDSFDKMLTMHPSIPIALMKLHSSRCKSVVANVNIFKSYGFMVIAALFGLMTLKNSHSVIDIDSISPVLKQLAGLIPDQYMSVCGPAALLAFIKSQKMDINSIQAKLEKI